MYICFIFFTSGSHRHLFWLITITCAAHYDHPFLTQHASTLNGFTPGLLRSEIPSGICAKLRTVAASNNRDQPTRSLYYCLFAPHRYIFVLRAHPVRGESHIQRNTAGEVATVLSSMRGFPVFAHAAEVSLFSATVDSCNKQ